MTSVTDTKSLLEHNSMPFAGALPGGEELAMQAAVSSAISLKRVADELECLTHELKTLRKIYEARGY